MSSLVLELQSQALDGKVKVSDLLRKALVLASKLKVKEFEEWAKNELHGYSTDSIPSYRHVKGELKAYNPSRGWIPGLFRNPEVAEVLTERSVSQSVGYLEELIGKRDQERVLTIQFPPEILSKTKPLPGGLIPELVIGESQIFGILDAVRNIILEWSLKLENDGIVGEGLTFSTEEQHIAATTNYTIQTFTGPVGAVAGRDINVQISLPLVLTKLAEALEAEGKIPPEEKQPLTHGLNSLAQNEWIRSVGTSLLADMIRKWAGI